MTFYSKFILLFCIQNMKVNTDASNRKLNFILPAAQVEHLGEKLLSYILKFINFATQIHSFNTLPAVQKIRLNGYSWQTISQTLVAYWWVIPQL